MSVVDPALLDTVPGDEESEWEYEYHGTETEHGLIRPPRRRNDPSASTTASAATTTDPTPIPSHPDDQDPAVINPDTDNAPAERVQILGLHTRNPIISYQNQLFSGTWADQLGTELFFARPETTATESDEPSDNPPAQITPLKHSEDFDLISANSVKILGRKAHLISNSGPAAEREAPTLDTTGLVYKPAHQSNQARFLERLKNVKRSKGETDATEEQMNAIQQLNDRAVQGDYSAMVELEGIYSQLGSQNAGPSEGPSHSG
ncbi:hypothetical protein BDW74DRAFT_181376 [Aspergillus multicolor]|uniref:TFIIIC subunit 6 family protein n=1 Tax=Aspergillus multicolor TaxID=41759 RepID=UPI003CCD07DF